VLSIGPGMCALLSSVFATVGGLGMRPEACTRASDRAAVVLRQAPLAADALIRSGGVRGLGRRYVDRRVRRSDVVLPLCEQVIPAMLSSLGNHIDRSHRMSPHIYRMLVNARLAELRRQAHRHYYI
jgi:hypothetical protein